LSFVERIKDQVVGFKKYQVSSIDQVKKEIGSGGWPVQKRDQVRKLLRLRS
jgi:hypothetical protein